MDIANDPDDGEQAQVAIHVAELNGVADGVLTGPAFASKRLADDGYVRRIRAIVLVKEPAANEGNLENLEVAMGDNSEIGDAKPFFLLG